MAFVEGPEKRLVIVAHVRQVFLTVLEDIRRPVTNDRFHSCQALLGGTFFAIRGDQVAQREHQCIGTRLVLDPIAFQRVFAFLMDRQSPLYQAIYTLLTSCEPINSQAQALLIERPKMRNGCSAANLNTLIYLVINVSALQ